MRPYVVQPRNRRIGVQHELLTVGGNSERILFLNERTGNVVENKGPVWKGGAGSRNVYEKKGI